jgi:hypothetical protein
VASGVTVTPVGNISSTDAQSAIAELDTKKVAIDSVVAATIRIVASKLAAVDTQPAFRIFGSGKQEWGPGGSAAPDTNLYRSAAGYLNTDTMFRVGLSLMVDQQNASQKIYFGSALDTNLYRDSPGVLKTDGVLNAVGGLQINGVPVGTGGGGSSSIAVAQTAHGLVVGNIVKLTGATTYAKAQADSAINAEVAGIVSAVAGANNFTLTTNGQVTGLTGLTAGAVYFLSPTTAGALTTVEPTTGGQVSKPVLIADSTTSGIFYNFRGAVIASGPLGQKVVTGSVSAAGVVLAGTGYTVVAGGSGAYTVNFAAGTFSAAPVVVITPSYGPAVAVGISSITATSFAFQVIGPLPSSGAGLNAAFTFIAAAAI